MKWAGANVQMYSEASGSGATPTPPIEIAGPNGSKVLMEFSRTYVNVVAAAPMAAE